MRIEVIDIYKEKYKQAYLIDHKNSDHRKNVCLIGFDGSRKCISYAKYIWEKHNNCFVPDGFQVDHINEDKTDDRIENLQLLTQKENLQKHHKYLKDNGLENPYITRVCPICGKEFLFKRRNLSSHPNPCCSRKCGGKKSHITHQKNLEKAKKVRD